MIYAQFLIGMLMYVAIAYASYSETFKASNWFYPVGVITAIVANLTWLWISKTEPDPAKILIKGLYWDSMLTAIYLVVPILMFGVRLTLVQGLGLGLVVAGLVVVKL